MVDVGGGPGFCTQGIVKAGVKTANITLLDQSPHQLAKARAKPDLAGVTVMEASGNMGQGREEEGCGRRGRPATSSRPLFALPRRPAHPPT